jgi:restriction system protein
VTVMNKPNILKSYEILMKVRTFKTRKSVLSYLKKINNYLMEEVVLSSLEDQGYSITRNDRYSGDGGIDGKVVIYGKTYYIQTKRYTNYISKKHMAEFKRLCDKDKVNGLFVHTGKTGRGTRRELKGSKSIHIVSGNKLYNLIQGKSFGIRRSFLYTVKELLISLIFIDRK